MVVVSRRYTYSRSSVGRLVMGGGIERVGVCVVGLLLVVLVPYQVSYWYLLLLVGWLVAKKDFFTRTNQWGSFMEFDFCSTV